MLHLVRCQISNVKNPIDMSCSFTEVCSESWVDCGYLVHDLEISDMNVLRRIARVDRRDQWDNHIRNCDIRENLGITSVEEAARVSRLRWFRHVQRMRDDRLPKRILSAEVPCVKGSWEHGGPPKNTLFLGTHLYTTLEHQNSIRRHKKSGGN